MPYVLRNRITQKYVTTGYNGDDADMSKARWFGRKNGATGCSSFYEGVHDVVPVKLTEDLEEGPFRKNRRYMTFQEYIDDFGGDYYRVGEKPTHRNARSETVADYPPHLTEVFIEMKPGEISQVIVFDKKSQAWGPAGCLLPVYPKK